MNKPIANAVYSVTFVGLMLFGSIRDADMPLGGFIQPLQRDNAGVTHFVTPTATNVITIK